MIAARNDGESVFARSSVISVMDVGMGGGEGGGWDIGCDFGEWRGWRKVE